MASFIPVSGGSGANCLESRSPVEAAVEEPIWDEGMQRALVHTRNAVYSTDRNGGDRFT
jgi:hypothetical protein